MGDSPGNAQWLVPAIRGRLEESGGYMSHAIEWREFLGSTVIYASEPMRRLMSAAEKVASTSASVLITGESGSGKEAVARAIHHYSPRRERAWVDVNCAALPEGLLESELFGYERGAFSGAAASKQGLFELADHGSLLLDEIGELDLRLQAKLLRVLDGAAYYRLGGTKRIPADVRLIAATNQDLKAAVREGRFRLDLYYRLCQIELAVAPLRERPADILPLADHFLEAQRPGLRFSREVAELLCRYSWPGNVRELRNVVVRASVFACGEEVVSSDLPEEFLEGAFSNDLHSLAVLPEMEKNAIADALETNHGHQRRAAAALGISRRTLQRKIKGYGLAMERRVLVAG